MMTNQRNKKEYTQIEINEIISLYESGISFTKIGLMLNRPKNTIKQILIDVGIWVEGRNNLKKEFTINEIDGIKSLYIVQKKSCRQIANIFGVSKTLIYRILSNKHILRKGNSNGIKIILTPEQSEKIKELYLRDYKTCDEIGEEMGLSKAFIDKYLNNCGFRRTKGEANTLVRTGVCLSEKTKLNMAIAQQKLAKSGNRKQTGGVCKNFIVNGLKCQGTYEKFYIEKLIKDGLDLPNESSSIQTPYGVYYPDFSFNNRLIEIKSDYTYDILVGKKISRFTNNFETKQYEKIKWVNANIKPVQLLVIDKRNNEIINKEIR